LGRPFASVLIDTYNHERFIEQAIVSVLEQDFPAGNREILVVDDGSTDKTPDIVRKFEPSVRLLRKPNGGQASAFNAGIPHCKGEFIAFLDGDDWWAPGKLRAVCNVLANDASVGLVGHGITETYSDGREHTELLREGSRLRIADKAGAELFRLRKSFLGTSRMTIRSDILRQIGSVPEALTIEADEYLFTLGALLADVLILREPLTFYRLHDSNAFQVADGNPDVLRRKQRVLAALGGSLRVELRKRGLAEEIARIVVESVETEADLLRLRVDNGMPWETVSAEIRNYRITHENASISHWLLKSVGLIPACVLPSRVYYSLRRRISENIIYRRARGKWLPFLEPPHVDRYRTTRP
jgi:glycosyltransferase involved in cell wall biosynthesis